MANLIVSIIPDTVADSIPAFSFRILIVPCFQNKVDSLRLVDLQEVLRTFGLSVYGKKKELRDRLVTQLIGNDPPAEVASKIAEVYGKL